MLQKLILGFVLFSCFIAFGQFKISGQILDENNKPIEGCHVHIGNKNTTSDQNGYYKIGRASCRERVLLMV